MTEANHTPTPDTARFGAHRKLSLEWLGAQHHGIIVCPETNDPRRAWFAWFTASAVRWTHQVVFRKNRDGNRPNYFVFRDSCRSLHGDPSKLQQDQVVFAGQRGGTVVDHAARTPHLVMLD